MAGTGTNRAERAGTDGRWVPPEERFRVRTVSVAFPVSNDGSRLVPPPNARFAPTAPAGSMCGSHSYRARGQARIMNNINYLRKVLRLLAAAHTSPSHLDAGWSSPVARQAHNLKVVSSNLAPATKIPKLDQWLDKNPAWHCPAGFSFASPLCPFCNCPVIYVARGS
jgi:hypothetical protein